MIDLNIKNNGDEVITEYLLKPNDRIDNLTLGMLVNNNIKGVISVTPVQIEKERYFRYNITGMVTLKKYLGEYIKKDKILKAFYGIALAIRESKEYMINWTSFSLEQKDIYINEKTGEVGLICLPILSVINDGNICNFFKNILFSSQFDMEENGDYVGKLITILNPKVYTLEKFIYELEDMLEIEHRVFEEKVEDIEEEDNEKEAVSQTVLEDCMEESEQMKAEDAEPEETAKAEEKAESEETAEAEEKAEPRETAEAEEKAEPEETAEAEERTESEETAGAEEKAESEETAETEGKTESTEEPEAGMEESEREEKPVIRPFLIRVSNNQKIMIDKDNFVIGKDEKKADYCIIGSSAIADEHAFIVRHEKEYFLIDNNSNYTYMNRVLIQPDEEVYIPHGAHLSFGDEDFEFRMHD